MRDTDIAYLAGIIDGEGSIGMSSGGAGIRRFVIEVKMTDEMTIRLLHAAFGGNVITRTPANPLWKPLWRWRVTGTAARQAYQQLCPYLRIKREGSYSRE
jgi:hypothetical protein